MRWIIQVLVVLCMIGSSVFAQSEQTPIIDVGDPAPALRLSSWIKGAPIQQFEKGKVYVVEFWATWCQPCIAAMPHLSDLAKKYKDKVYILAIDIYEKETISPQKVKAFVDSMGYRMDYNVAVEDSNFMEIGWMKASAEENRGIPRSFVINAEGKLAWIGYPTKLEKVLAGVANGTWDIKEELAKRTFNRHLEKLDREAGENLNLSVFVGDRFKQGDHGNPDSALSVINSLIAKEPKLKYAPFIASHTFSSLLKTDPHKAYEYGKVAIITPTYEDAACYSITSSIEWYSSQMDLPAEIFRLGAEAYQLEIDQIPFPELVNIPKRYNKMAEWYSCAGDKSKAIEAQQKAIEVLKSRKGFSETNLAAFESRLEQYKKM